MLVEPGAGHQLLLGEAGQEAEVLHAHLGEQLEEPGEVWCGGSPEEDRDAVAPGLVPDDVIPRHLDVDDLGPGHEVAGGLADLPGQRLLLLQGVPPRPLVGEVASRDRGWAT